MNSVYAYPLLSVDWQNLPAELRNFSLFRRMTPLQKVSVGAFLLAHTKFPQLLAQAERRMPPVYFFSHLGEVSAMLSITQSILANEPPSPKDFQHSVLNAALNYIFMQANILNPGFALTGDEQQFQWLLQMIIHDLQSQGPSTAMIICAEEPAEAELSRAKIMVLQSQRDEHCSWQIVLEGAQDSVPAQLSWRPIP